MRTILPLCTALALLAAPLPARAGEEVRQDLARRAALAAAKADAVNRLSAKVMALRVTAATSVETFVSQRLEIAAGLDLFLHELVEAAKGLDAPDGSCKVSVVLPLDALATRLQLLYTAAFQEKAGTPIGAAEMIQLNAVKAVTADGFGNPPEALIPPPLLVAPAGAAHAELTQAEPAVQAFWAANASSRGLALAELAAAHRAAARLAAAMEALPLREGLFVRDVLGAPDSPFRTELLRVARRTPEVGRRYYGNVLQVEIELSVPMDTFYQSLLNAARQCKVPNRGWVRAMEEAARARRNGTLDANGVAAVAVRHLTKQASPSARQGAQLASNPPAWASQTLTIEGTAPAANDPAQAVRAAQRAAVAKLLEAVLALPAPSRRPAPTSMPASLPASLPALAPDSLKTLTAADKDLLSTIACLCGAAPIAPGPKPIQPDGSARVSVVLDLDNLWRVVLAHQLRQPVRPDWSTRLE